MLCPVLCFLCLTVFCYPACASISDDFVRKGNERMKDNDFVQAIVYYENALNADPDNSMAGRYLSAAYHNLAGLNYKDGHMETAIRNELSALKLDPANKTIKEQLSVYYNNLALQYADRENYEKAVYNMEQAYAVCPESQTVKLNLYNVLIGYADYEHRKKNNAFSIELAKKAIEIIPDNAQAYLLLGSIYHKLDDFAKTVEAWKKALEIDPSNSDLKERLEAVLREKSVEKDFGTSKKSYFRIRYDKEIQPGYVTAISDILTNSRRNIRDAFGLYTDEVIPVIIYDEEQFSKATAQPHWTQGLYDGKIRVRYQDISEGNDNLSRVLCHEYAHAVLYLNIGITPIWLNEGFAQYNEPGRALFNPNDKAFLKGYMDINGDFSVYKLDSMFAAKDNDQAIRAAYLQSRLFFNYLVEKYTRYNMERFFQMLKQGAQWETAFIEAFRVSIERQENNFNSYLKDLLK
jgi:tetratricopeptide (TPR) repeat protein